MPSAATTLVDVMGVLGLIGETWAPWRCVAKCLDGLPLMRDEQALFEACTGRTRRSEKRSRLTRDNRAEPQAAISIS